MLLLAYCRWHAAVGILPLADVNGNGVLSLTEVDLGLRELLDAQMSAQQISDRRVSDALSPAITRAFHAAKDSKHSLSGEDAAARARSVETVSKDEFKLLVVALKRCESYPD